MVPCSSVSGYVVFSSVLLFAAAVLTPGDGGSRSTSLVPVPRAVIAQAPLLFEMNTGQTSNEVQFLSRGRGYTLFLSAREAVLRLSGASLEATSRTHVAGTGGEHPEAPPDQTVRMRLEGAAQVRGVALAPANAKVNYLVGNDASKWRTGIPTFGRVQFPDVYPGIDILYYGNNGRLEYDFVVAPGADPSAIRLAFDGTSTIAIGSEGELELYVADRRLRFQKPFAYQELPSGNKAVNADYVLRADHSAAFEIADYDRSRPLIIDPVLLYSTYLGGSSGDAGSGIAVGADGSVYLTGYTSSTNFPLAPAPVRCLRDCPFQTTLAGGSDVFVSKFDPSGALEYSTYIGGTGNDQGNAIGVDADGNAYIAGSTVSTDFPIKPSPCGGSNPPCPFRASNAGADDAFVAKLHPSGSKLVYATYIGGSSFDRAFDLDVINDGAAVVIVGETFSGDFPTVSPFQAVSGGGYDAFVTWISADGSYSLFSSYLGGSGADRARGVDAGNGYWIVGSTISNNFPVAGSSIPQATRRGFYDGFVSVIVANELFASTYFGGSANDEAHDVLIIPGGGAYVVGETHSADFQLARAVQTTHGGGADAFAARFSSGNLSLFFSTYFGGSGNDIAYGVARDDTGAAVFAGSTNSPDLPLSQAFQENFGGSFDAFVASIPSAGSTLRYASYLGGTGQDQARAIATGAPSTVYLTGFTESADFPTLNPEQPTRAGGTDAFYAKLSADAPPVANAGPDQTLETDNPASTAVTLDGSASSDPDGDSLAYEWRNSGGTVVGNTAIVILSLPLGTHTFTLIVADGRGGSDADSVTLDVVRDTTPPAVRLIAPDGGEKLFTGTPYPISFTASDAVGVGSHDVELSTDGGTSFSPIPGCTDLPAAARSCTWMSPSPLTSTARMRVITQDTSGNISLDASAANFSIVPGSATVTVTSPNTGVDWGIGSNQQIKWSHNLGLNSYMHIEKSSDGGETWSTLVESFKNTGATSSVYNWQVTGAPSEEARIRVSWTAAPHAADMSNVNFIISPVYIVVGSPATTATNYGYGTSRKQTWTTNLGPLDRVEVWLSTDGGATFSTLLGSAVATTKTVSYIVPNLVAPTVRARIRALWFTDAAVYGTTPVDFNVAPPFIKVVTPNGPSDVWPIGSSQTINWIHNLGNIENVKIDLSLDGGATYNRAVLASTPSDGKQAVTVSSSWTSSTARIKISWLKDAAVSDTSNQNFPIQ